MLPPPPSSTYNDSDAGSAAYEQLRPQRSRRLRPSSSSSAAAPRCHPSPFHPSASAVPFSWERRPGIPKASGPLVASSTARPLLPPPLRSSSLRIKDDLDPFAAALAECAKSPPGPDTQDLFGRNGGRGRRSPAAAGWSISDRLGLCFRTSCKAACAVADSTVLIRRSSASYGRLNRRST